MDERRKGALKKHQQALRTGLLVGSILPALRPVLTDVEYSRVEERENNISRVDELTNILLTKENRHFDVFCAVLKKCGYENWAKKLQKEAPPVDDDIAIDLDGAQSSSKGNKTVGVRWRHSRLVELYIDTVTSGFERDGKLFKVLVGFGTGVADIGQKVLHAVKEADNVEIKAIYEVKDALHGLTMVVEFAYGFLDKVDDIFYYCQSDLMKAAIQELSCTPPKMTRLRGLISLLGVSLSKAEENYSELVEACNIARLSCTVAAEVCARKATESQNKKGITKGVGGTVAGATLAGGTAAAAGGVAAGGVAISAVAGAFTFGIGTIVGLGVTAVAVGAIGLGGLAAGVGTAVVTDRIAKKYKASEDTFRSTRAKFDDLLSFAHELKEGVAQVHTTQANISAKVDNVKDSTDKENIALIKETLERLEKACSDTYATTSACRDEVKSRLEELKSKVK